MLNEVGSNFWLDKESINTKNKNISLDFLNVNVSDFFFLSTGRSSIAYVLKNLEGDSEKKKALLPCFTCDTVIEPFIEANYEVEYYEIDKNLICSEEKLLAAIKKFEPTVILLHGYFGFNTLKPLKKIITEIKNEITIIEDITQTIYSSFDHLKAHYYIGSLRKWLPLPDGGLVISDKNPLKYKTEKVDENLLKYKLKAFNEKFLYMEKKIGEKKEFLQSYSKAEKILDEQNSIFAMHDISKSIQANLNIKKLIYRRRENFNILSQKLRNIANISIIFMDTLSENTPLYFPIYVNGDRAELQKFLAENKIFVPVIWPKPEQIDEKVLTKEASWIYKHILAIPCDQRYTIEEMNYISDKIKDFYSR